MSDVIQAARDVVARRDAYDDTGLYQGVPLVIDDGIDNIRTALAEWDAGRDELVALLRECRGIIEAAGRHVGAFDHILARIDAEIAKEVTG